MEMKARIELRGNNFQKPLPVKSVGVEGGEEEVKVGVEPQKKMSLIRTSRRGILNDVDDYEPNDAFYFFVSILHPNWKSADAARPGQINLRVDRLVNWEHELYDGWNSIH